MPEMTEPQTLDEVMDDITSDSQEPEEVETPEQSTETPEQEEQESYTRIDPKTLPPELQAMHKSLLGDYTKKTQSVAQMRKELEARQAEIEQFKQQYQTQEQPQQQIPQDVNPNMSVEEYTAYLFSQMDQRLSAHEQKLLEQQEQKYLDNAVAEFEAADERLNEQSPAYDPYMRTIVGEALDKELHQYQEQHGTAIGFDYQARTNELVEQYEKHIEEKAKSIASQKTREAFKGAKRTAPTSVRGTKAPTKATGEMSIDDALDAAFSS